MALWDRVKSIFGYGKKTAAAVVDSVKSFPQKASELKERVLAVGRVRLYYFDEILPFEFAAIERRRARVTVSDAIGRPSVRGKVEPIPRPAADPNESQEDDSRAQDEPPGDSIGASKELRTGGPHPPDSPQLFRGDGRRRLPRPANADKRAQAPDRDKTRPRPAPCNATGLVLSGGGIRSAAVSLGALQALEKNRRLGAIDYLSTVSGGGYIGACLSAAMSCGNKLFPFGTDVCDSATVAHLRNYSNYLMPRGRSGLRNVLEAALVWLRGLVANAIIVLAVLLGCALATASAYSGQAELGVGSMVPRLLDALLAWFDVETWAYLGRGPFGLTGGLAFLLGVVLLAWAFFRAFPLFDRLTGDTAGFALRRAYSLLVATLVAAFLDLQPLAIKAVIRLAEAPPSPVIGSPGQRAGELVATLVALSTAVAAVAGPLGRFLETSRHGAGWRIVLRRALAKAAIVAAGLVLPVALWIAYLWLSAWAIEVWTLPGWLDWPIPKMVLLSDNPVMRLFQVGLAMTVAVGLSLKANAYSFHRFYRDRLSKAFLFETPVQRTAQPKSLDRLKLSRLKASKAPYHLINAAMNVQGSKEANRRGRNADFFIFSSQFVGSDLTLYASTAAATKTDNMERIDPRLDLATAMAISGAAVSANMGSNTNRMLSPTLALLNVRLGYWLPNPRNLTQRNWFGRGAVAVSRQLREKFYLFAEMMNLHDETSNEVYLTDGGHIENLGLYELLKRGCELVVVVDGEADPYLSFSSLLKVERYARIDLGVRIVLPWEELADAAKETAAGIARGERPCRNGPHCAVGRIIYENGELGTLVYFKSSLSGDEKDYILDYKVRNGNFPHERTSDQFFTEEQFEMYRALGFHMVDGFFTGSDRFAYQTRWGEGFKSAQEVRDAVDRMIPAEIAPA